MLILFNGRDFHYSHTHVPSLQEHTLSNQANSTKWEGTKLIKEKCWTSGWLKPSISSWTIANQYKRISISHLWNLFQMKEVFYFLNTTPRKGHFDIFEPVNDPTLVWKISPKVKKELMACVECHNKLKSLNICKMCNWVP